MPKTGHFKTISILTNLSKASCDIKHLKFMEPKKVFIARPQIHIGLQSEIGSVKSTLLDEIKDRYWHNKIEKNTGLTFASVVGTIDNMTKQIIPPVTWDCRNKHLLVDEFKWSDKGELINALLQLLEGQEYTRRFGLFSSDSKLKDKDLYFTVKAGEIKLRTRFSMIFATMHNLKQSTDIMLRALKSRLLLYAFKLSRKELQTIAEGAEILEPMEYDPPESITIPKDIYKKILRIVNNANIHSDDYLRTVGDCCRVYAVSSYHKDKEKPDRMNTNLMKLVLDLHRKEKVKE